MICPYCGKDNIEGADVCYNCQEPLDHLSLPTPKTRVEQALMRDRLRVLGPRTPVVVPPSAPVGDVLRLMIEHRIGCALVVDDDKLVGIFTERDVLLRINTDIDNCRSEPVSKFMTADPVTLEETDKIAFALHKMDLGGYRHIPVMKDGRVHGVISIRDILNYITDELVAAEDA